MVPLAAGFIRLWHVNREECSLHYVKLIASLTTKNSILHWGRNIEAIEWTVFAASAIALSETCLSHRFIDLLCRKLSRDFGVKHR